MLAFLGAGCAKNIMANKISFLTLDGVKIVGNWFPAKNGAPVVLLLHMMPATKESWNDFAAKLNAAGFSALAIDLRGHGESTEQSGQSLNYAKFTDAEHQASSHDVDAALDWLKSQDVKKIYLGGASIGANLVIDAMARRAEIKKGFALSAGIDYHGVKTVAPAGKLQVGQDLYLVAAKDDTRSGGPAEQMAQEIYKAASSKKEIKIYDAGGHGTDLFTTHPELMDELINWLK